MAKRQLFIAALVLSMLLVSGGLCVLAQRSPNDMITEPPGLADSPSTSPGTLSVTTPVAAFQKGASFTTWARGPYSLDDTVWVIEEQIKGVGATWIAVVVQCYQETVTSTEINCESEQVPSDAELERVIQVAKRNGLRVMLKPHISLSNDPDHWRGQIDFGNDETRWAMWFNSYQDFILHYAQLAESLQVDQFCVGTELYDAWLGIGPARRTADWRHIIAQIRQTYSGPLTYASNWGEEEHVEFWDDLDYIGVDAYYPLTDTLHPSVSDLIAAWEEPYSILEQLTQRWNKPVIFTEIGYPSIEGAAWRPWAGETRPLDLEVQADAYEAVFQKFGDQTWWKGVYWWNWDPNYMQGGSYDLSFVPQGKPAEEVLRYYYLSEIPLQNRGLHIIYDDTLSGSWQDWSWGDVDWSNSTVVHSGATAAAVTLGGWGGFSLHPTQLFNTDPYSYLEFYINGGSEGGQRLHISFGTPDHPSLSEVVMGNYIYSALLPPDEWRVVRIPIEDLNRSGELINRITIKNFDPNPAAQMFIDDIRFVERSVSPAVGGLYLPLLIKEID